MEIAPVPFATKRVTLRIVTCCRRSSIEKLSKVGDIKANFLLDYIRHFEGIGLINLYFLFLAYN